MGGIFWSVLYGILRISKLPHPPVTVFGGARLHLDSVYSKKARELAHRLADAGIPVLTGGGPGIMEAANCGAGEAKKGVITTLGITVSGLTLNEQPKSCPVDVIVMHNYGARKWLLINYAIGFAVFPGGFGTLDELMELLTLMQTKFREKAPVVLIGRDYWKPFIEWMHESALKENLIAPEDVELFVLTDDIDEAFRILHACASKKS
jgi:uncharacterized protein (TIGR00730 family)